MGVAHRLDQRVSERLERPADGVLERREIGLEIDRAVGAGGQENALHGREIVLHEGREGLTHAAQLLDGRRDRKVRVEQPEKPARKRTRNWPKRGG